MHSAPQRTRICEGLAAKPTLKDNHCFAPEVRAPYLVFLMWRKNTSPGQLISYLCKLSRTTNLISKLLVKLFVCSALKLWHRLKKVPRSPTCPNSASGHLFTTKQFSLPFRNVPTLPVWAEITSVRCMNWRSHAMDCSTAAILGKGPQ